MTEVIPVRRIFALTVLEKQVHLRRSDVLTTSLSAR